MSQADIAKQNKSENQPSVGNQVNNLVEKIDIDPNQVLTPETIKTINKEKVKANLLSDFVGFIQKYGVVGLAIGVVIGQAVTKLVNSIVENLINPILAKIIGQVDLSNFKPFDIKIGAFVNDLINFLVITFVVYLAIRFFIIRFLGEEEKTKLNFLEK